MDYQDSLPSIEPPSSDSPALPPPVAPKRSPFRSFFLGLLAVIILVFVGGYVFLLREVRAVSMNGAVLKAAKILRVPAARMNGEAILYTDYANDVRTLKKYYAENIKDGPMPTEEQVSDQVLSRLLANALVGSVADYYHITLDEGEKTRAKESLVAKFPGLEKAEEELQRQYGWSVDTYLAKVVYPLLREEKLHRAYASSTDAFGASGEEEQVEARHILFLVKDPKTDAQMKAKADAVLKRVNAGEDFAKLAKQFGTDDTKDIGGELGWFGSGIMVPEFEQAVFKLQAGERTVVKSPFGYHVVEVEGRRTARNFVKFMDGQLKNANVRIYMAVHDPFERIRASEAGR